MSKARLFASAITAVLLPATAPVSLPAQASGTATAAVATVWIVQADELPAPGGRAVIVRRASGAPREMIILPASGATAADLASALSLLARLREQDGGQLPAPQQRISVTSAAFAEGQPPAVQQHFQGLLDRLSNAPAQNVPGFGRGRALIVPQNRATAG